MHIQHTVVTRSFAAIQIAGAASALLILLTTIPTIDSGFIGWSLFLILLVVVILALAGGVAYWLTKSWGCYVTALVYVLQLIQISSEWVLYKLSFGVSVAINLMGPEGWLNLHFGSQTFFIVWPGSTTTSVSLNIFAGFALATILDNARKNNLAADTESTPDNANDTFS